MCEIHTPGAPLMMLLSSPRFTAALVGSNLVDGNGKPVVLCSRYSHRLNEVKAEASLVTICDDR